MGTKTLLFSLFFTLLFLSSSFAKVQLGSFSQKTQTNWQFLGKFVFQAGDIPNVLSYNITTSNENLRALLYFWDNPTRELAGSNFYSDYEQFLNGEIDCANFSSRHVKGGNHKIQSGVPGRFRPSSVERPYFWFLAVSDCSVKQLDIRDYNITFLQTDGGHWEYHFSWDEWGIGPFTLFFLIYYILLLGVHGYACYQLWRIEAYHTIIKLYSFAVVMEFLGYFLSYIHYASYAENGIGAPAIKGLGSLADMTSQLALMFLCILIAKGWAITTSYLTQKYLLLAITGMFIVLFISLFIWTEFLLDPVYSLFSYGTPPGVILLLIRFGTVFWFFWCIRDTLRIETNPEKRNFYYPFAIAYGIWFISLPLSVFVLGFTNSWARLRIITITAMFCDAIGLSVLAYLFWPSRARNYFSIRSTGLLEKKNTVTDKNL